MNFLNIIMKMLYRDNIIAMFRLNQIHACKPQDLLQIVNKQKIILSLKYNIEITLFHSIKAIIRKSIITKPKEKKLTKCNIKIIVKMKSLLITA